MRLPTRQRELRTIRVEECVVALWDASSAVRLELRSHLLLTAVRVCSRITPIIIASERYANTTKC